MKIMTMGPTSSSPLEDLDKTIHIKHLEQPLAPSKYAINVRHSYFYELLCGQRTVPSALRDLRMSKTWPSHEGAFSLL